MKKSFFVIGLCFGLALCGLSQTNQAAQKSFIFPTKITTRSGQVYERVKFQGVRGDEANIVYFDDRNVMQMGGIKLTNLPEDLRNQILAIPKQSSSRTNQSLIMGSIQSPTVGSQMLKTTDGIYYDIISYDRTEPDYLYVTHIVRGQLGGIYHTAISYDVLPDDIFKKFHFDLADAASHRKVRLEVEAVQREEYQRRVREFRQVYIENENLKAAQDTAIAMKQQAEQQRRSADAADLQAKADMIKATNQPVTINTTVIQQKQTVIQVQQNQVNY